MEMHFTADGAHDGVKLGSYLRGEHGFSSTLIKKIKACDGASVDGVPVHMGHILRAGQQVYINLPEKTTSERPHDIGLEPVYMDDYLFAINKPAGVGMYRMYDEDDVNVIAGVLAMEQRLGMKDNLVRPVSRLDRDTTGLILFARYPQIQQQLQLKQQYAKQYILITDGIPPEDHGFIDFPILKDDERSFRMSCGTEGKSALTEYTVIDRSGAHALVAARLHTGRTHQLRVHFTEIGCPIHGDTLYGSPSPAIPGQALHCIRVCFRHPVTSCHILLEAPLPSAFRSALEYCGLDSDVRTKLPEILC